MKQENEKNQPEVRTYRLEFESGEIYIEASSVSKASKRGDEILKSVPEFGELIEVELEG